MGSNKWVKKRWFDVFQVRAGKLSLVRFLTLLLLLFFICAPAYSQNSFEDRPIADVTVTFQGSDRNIAANERLKTVAREALGSRYSAVKVRDAIEALYDTGQVASISVEAADSRNGAVDIRFLVRRKTQAQKVSVQIIGDEGETVTEQELLLRLNLLQPGRAITEQTLKNNADVMLEYLRDRGFYQAEVAYSQAPLENDTEVGVVFRVKPGIQAKVESFNVNIKGFDTVRLLDETKLKPGVEFTREQLNRDVEKVREILREQDYLAPSLEEPRVVYDRPKNMVAIDLVGDRGPKVEVVIDAERDRPGGRTQMQLLPVKREGTLDYAAIVEGERRLENHFQEQGYFFANVVSRCSVDPPLKEGEAATVTNNTEFLCSALSSADLANRSVKLTYHADLNRQLKLVDIRLQGTNQLTADDIKTVLDTQEANIFGIIPIFGYGRGYTSERILEKDAATVRSLLRELGFLQAEVRVNQGVTPAGDNLIITFVVEEGPRTIISGVDITGNSAFSDDELTKQLPTLTGTYFSRAKIRNGQRKLAQFYSQAGYFDTVVEYSIDQGPADPNTGERLYKVVYHVRHRPDPFSADAAALPEGGTNVEGEGKKFFVDRILVTGNDRTKTDAVLRALTLRSGELLRSGDVYTSEQNLYASDAFARVEIKPRYAGVGPDGSQVTDLIVNVEEQAPRILSYGGGFSTDLGLSGFADIRHFNLLGRLWQGGARVRLSQRQQLAQLDFINPRFIRDGKKRFAPLTLSASYQRDSTVTRFFRSAFDKGTFGIVQRVDEDGSPIDDFGNQVSDPTLNRLTLTAETNRTISRKDRSIVFFRYRFEDARLYNLESLLIKDLLIPDSRVRVSGFGVTYVRDTREDCSIRYTILDIIARGEAPAPCRYSATDPTRGSYLTAEYNVSLPILGANFGFNKFQVSYNMYYTLPLLQRTKFTPIRNTTFAARAILGLANVFSGGDRFDPTAFPGLNGILPISERFFAGGAYTLRGFDFEEAGPRVVEVPQGIFRNSKGEPVFLDPFTVPFGGNALAIVNLEARIPLTTSIRVVPFYDGGNVFRRVGDIFNPPDVPPDDVTQRNLRALWSHTIGLGIRLRLPFGGEFGMDYGHLLNPPRFLIPQTNGTNAIYQLRQDQVHFRYSHAF
jgi:outer membrane protein insertion porin family